MGKACDVAGSASAATLTTVLNQWVSFMNCSLLWLSCIVVSKGWANVQWIELMGIFIARSSVMQNFSTVFLVCGA
jgi:hypothetical protein